MEEKDEQNNKPQTPIEKFNDDLKDYLATRYELTLLKTSQKISIMASVMTFGAIMVLLGILFLLFLFVAAGFYLSELLGSFSLGFLCLSGVFLFFGLILFLGRKKWIFTPIRNGLIKAMFDED